MIKRGMEMYRIIALFCVSLFVVATLSAFAADANAQQSADSKTCEGAHCFPGKVVRDGQELDLYSTASFEYYFLDVYSAALYLPPGIESSHVLSPQTAKELVISYDREFSKEDFKESGETLIAENPKIPFQIVAPGLQQIAQLYRPVKEGDRYSISYLPGKGTALLLNGLRLGVVPGEEFSSAYFGIWLSDKSIGEEFTQKLLQKRV